MKENVIFEIGYAYYNIYILGLGRHMKSLKFFCGGLVAPKFVFCTDAYVMVSQLQLLIIFV